MAYPRKFINNLPPSRGAYVHARAAANQNNSSGAAATAK